jgi:hypothetical protein
MSPNPAFLAHRWPKRHRWTIQECKPLSVADFVQARTGMIRARLPDVRIVEQAAGCVRRSYVVCPKCRNLCQHLYLPPETRRSWACRKCHNIIYASQRYGRKHLLRRILPPRARLNRIIRNPVFPNPEWWPDIPSTRGRNPFRNFKALTDAVAKYAADRQRLPWWKRSRGAHDGADRSRERRVSFGQGSA